MHNPQSPQPAVVVGIDGSDTALHAVRWAAREANARETTLRIVHTAPPDDHDLVSKEAGTDHESGVLLAAAEAASERAPYPMVELVYREGTPSFVLRLEAAAACMLVIGSLPPARPASVALGSTAAELTATAPCPVAVVRATREPSTGRAGLALPIVAILSGPESSWDAVLSLSTDEARIRLTTVTVVASEDSSVASDTVTRRIARWQALRPDVRLSSIQQRGNLPSMALRLSASAQLVVVGPPEHDRLPLVGPTSLTAFRLLRHSEHSILIVHSRPSSLSMLEGRGESALSPSMVSTASAQYRTVQ